MERLVVIIIGLFLVSMGIIYLEIRRSYKKKVQVNLRNLCVKDSDFFWMSDTGNYSIEDLEIKDTDERCNIKAFY
jgi:hypothetical protein